MSVATLTPEAASRMTSTAPEAELLPVPEHLRGLTPEDAELIERLRVSLRAKEYEPLSADELRLRATEEVPDSMNLARIGDVEPDALDWAYQKLLIEERASTEVAYLMNTELALAVEEREVARLDELDQAVSGSAAR